MHLSNIYSIFNIYEFMQYLILNSGVNAIYWLDLVN